MKTNCSLSVSFVYVLFSPCREKSEVQALHKRAPLKGVTHGASLEKPTT